MKMRKSKMVNKFLLGKGMENLEKGMEKQRKRKPQNPPVEEEMPSFDEWKEKMLQEEELKKREQARLASLEQNQGQASKKPASPPVRPKFSLTENSKNHASSDCGAKLLSTNKESQSPSAILNINPDLYMLNPCTATIKFVVELCEPIQVKQIEIANYELFSSVPESFRVSISDRYPAREWHLLGTFHARNERVLQSFPLHDEQMFAKYMKFEMLTFFGSEHYCPLSVLRVFGTNVVEEIEDADAVDDDINPPEVLPLHPTPLPDDDKQKNGLLESARDVVIGLVQRAAKVLADPDWKDEDLPCLPEDAPNNNSVNATSELHTSDPAQLPYEEHLEICMPSIYKQCVGVDIDFSSMRQLCRGQSCCFCPNYAERFEYCRRPSKIHDEYRCCKDTNVCGLDKGALEHKETVKEEQPAEITENKDKNIDSCSESKRKSKLMQNIHQMKLFNKL
ncbi:SUN domain-containing ossification factor-like isoform X2 [Amphiura filiformis]|uniref:SUN domain-containing ossification factor-like isoform X2 n=1 Tax=Amphiura filiformis TaxID=82378 RepID=UPI003B20E8F7